MATEYLQFVGALVLFLGILIGSYWFVYVPNRSKKDQAQNALLLDLCQIISPRQRNGNEKLWVNRANLHSGASGPAVVELGTEASEEHEEAGWLRSTCSSLGRWCSFSGY